jgi:hypothetical protein
MGQSPVCKWPRPPRPRTLDGWGHNDAEKERSKWLPPMKGYVFAGLVTIAVTPLVKGVMSNIFDEY